MTKESQSSEGTLEKIVSLAKRRGFVFQGSEIYGGLAGMWDYGPLGVSLKRNIVDAWWKKFVSGREDMYAVDTAVIMNPRVWEASGHVKGFADSLESGQKFNVMFKTSVGAGDGAVGSFLRPETAQGTFVNFKNVIDSFHPKLPFGIAQVGKAFRNEIAPRDFLFRSREFEQMEVEYFIREKDWQRQFDYWREEMLSWVESIGVSRKSIHELEVPPAQRAHYSKRTLDFEYDFPFGRKELYGLAYRGDFDLKSHQSASGTALEYLDEDPPAGPDGTVGAGGKDRFIPHVIEPTFGVDRTVLALLCEAYNEDELGGEKRVFLKFPKHLAPVRVAVFPLLKNKPNLVAKAREVFRMVRKEIPNAMFDDNGNIGKRYRRQDEIGTPHCITVDFETLENDTVTVRDRDSGRQERFAVHKLAEVLS
ncbi:glycine--tRNA ligase [Patescibacteria group bacterium]|nr:MAG: glycine--tRNA ligase [Patescibacteria group bacterium]